MNKPTTVSTLHATVIDDDAEITLVQMCRACRVGEDQLLLWIREGVLQPVHAHGAGAGLRFRGSALRRARVASRLSRDLELDAPGLALALDLLDEIDVLHARLARAGL